MSIIHLTPNTPAAPATIEGVAARVDPLGWLQRRNDKKHVSFESLVPSLRERSRIADSQIVSNKSIELFANPDPKHVDDLNELSMVVDGQVMGFTHHSFGQIASLAKAPAAYLRTLPGALTQDAINYGLQFNRDVESIQLYHDGHELRAATGPGYGRVPDFQVAEAVQSILDDGVWKPAEAHMGLSVTDRSLNMFLLDESRPVEVGTAPNGDPDIMYRGLRIINSEVGAASLKIEAFLFRGYCLNGMIFNMRGNSTTTIRHSKGAPSRWVREVQPAIERYTAQDAMTLVEAVEKAKTANVVSDNEAAVEWLQRRKLTRSQARAAVQAVQDEENRNPRSVWDMAQGVTAVARQLAHVDDRAELERIGGHIFAKASAA